MMAKISTQDSENRSISPIMRFAVAVSLTIPIMAANAAPIFSNSTTVLTATNTATFDGISGSLLNYTEDNIVVSVNDSSNNGGSFAGTHYGDGGNNDGVTISRVDGGTISALDFLLGDGYSSDVFGSRNTNLIWETFSGTTSTGFGTLSLATGTTVGWTDTSGFTSLRVASGGGNVNSFGDFQAIALDNVRIGNATEVSEPASLGIMALGLTGLGFLRRRRANQA